MKRVYVKTREKWRKWLNRNHETNTGIWLVFYKKHTGKPTLEYDAAVEDALCFGWIDSILKRIDDEIYVRKFTPRRRNSQWSELNKKRVKKLTAQGLMTESGVARVKEAKESGLWDKQSRPNISFEIPKELERALAKNKKAKAFFENLAPTYRKRFIAWIVVAKRQQTKARRVSEATALLEKGKKLGMK